MTDAAYYILKILNRGNDVLGRYWDLTHPKKQEKTGTEIAAEIIQRHGLKVVG